MTMYLGRFQQGQEIQLVLQCVDANDAPDDPADVPVCSIYQDDDSAPTLLETVKLAADLRGVTTGLFRLPHFLGQKYDTAGRYLLIFRWQDSDDVGHCRVGSFHLLPGGSADGAVISMAYIERPDARHLIWQTDSGRLIRGRNPR